MLSIAFFYNKKPKHKNHAFFQDYINFLFIINLTIFKLHILLYYKANKKCSMEKITYKSTWWGNLPVSFVQPFWLLFFTSSSWKSCKNNEMVINPRIMVFVYYFIVNLEEKLRRRFLTHAPRWRVVERKKGNCFISGKLVHWVQGWEYQNK